MVKKDSSISMQGKTALITGAGSGIGKATARMFAQAGASVGVLTHTAKEAKETVRELKAAGHEAIALTVDVASEAQMARAFRRLRKQWGRLDFVMANAGINGLWAPLEEIKARDWDKTLNTNLRGTFLTAKFAAPLMKKHGGAIVVVSSVNGTRLFSNTGASAYSASKAGQVAFARMIALELAKHSIRVNTICPGAIETSINDNTKSKHLKRIREPVKFPEGQIPLTDGQPAEASQVAELALFLASDHAKHITGTEVFIDGAQSLLQG